MAKLNTNYPILVIFTLLIATKIRASDELRLDNICLNNQNLVKVHFYVHDVSGGPNSTVQEVARAAVSTDDPLSFGKILVLDDMITTGPGRDSKELGKLQGIITSADMKITAMAMSINVVFTSGEYKGSTLSIAGRNQVLDRERRMAVVGGTGVFRFTRGYAIISTYSNRVEDSGETPSWLSTANEHGNPIVGWRDVLGGGRDLGHGKFFPSIKRGGVGTGIFTAVSAGWASPLAGSTSFCSMPVCSLSVGGQENEKLAKIQFYAQDVIGGPNATVHEVARAAVSTDALLSFGKVFVIDDVITVGPSADTEALGKAQGIMTSADMETVMMAMSYNIVFTSGEYNGSVLSVAGRNEVAEERRRLAVVGGTGVFRFARGYAVVSTYSTAVAEDSGVYTVLEYAIYSTFCP
ncbi:dirigent protein 11-like [Salvia divinorum]|uniref:Dirigent protein n=1 Tax=Salvia divinorum TaxID=28513 RepID=A0ABD1HD92_SALDI